MNRSDATNAQSYGHEGPSKHFLPVTFILLKRVIQQTLNSGNQKMCIYFNWGAILMCLQYCNLNSTAATGMDTWLCVHPHILCIHTNTTQPKNKQMEKGILVWRLLSCEAEHTPADVHTTKDTIFIHCSIVKVFIDAHLLQTPPLSLTDRAPKQFRTQSSTLLPELNFQV